MKKFQESSEVLKQFVDENWDEGSLWIGKTTFCSSWRFVDEIPLWADDDSGTCGMIKCNNFPRSWISVGNETFLRSWEMGWGRDNHFTKQLTNGAKLSALQILNKKGQVEILSKEMEMFWRESEKSRKSWWLFRANFYDIHDLGITWQSYFRANIHTALEIGPKKSLIHGVWKSQKKVSFNIASETSYVYILSGQKLIKNPQNCPFWRVFENLKLAVKQCYQTGHF